MLHLVRISPVNQTQTDYDLLVIGGGINGAGIAADAAGRGLKVALVEKGDLASATSSWSSKLIHGGLRYLEQYQFALVRKSLQEREILTAAARHIIKPLAFQIPMLGNSRNGLLLRVGLFVYDYLVQRGHYKRSRSLSYGVSSPFNSSIRSGFEYWDAQVDDSRLVLINALQAQEHGADILTRTEVVDVHSDGYGWHVMVRDHIENTDQKLRCKVLVNAAGPWVSQLHAKLMGDEASYKLRLVKGSHIVLPKLHDQDNAFLLQHHDGRVIFVIPYLGKYSLVGTTEEEYEGDLDKPTISDAERDYLIAIVNLYFKNSVSRSDVVGSYSGIRPLIESEGTAATKVSRDYKLHLDKKPSPLLSVYGGKVTTFRVLAEQVMNQLGPFFPRTRGSWTKRATLPGGDFELSENLFQDLASQYSWLRPDIIRRWQRSYGTLAFKILKNTRSMGDMGVCFGANLYQSEVDYLCEHEWAHTAEDILWRRTKLGYQFSDREVESLSNYLSQSRDAA